MALLLSEDHMSQSESSTSLVVTRQGYITILEISKPPNNFIDLTLVQEIAAALEAADSDTSCRAIVLASAGKHFCAGADLPGSQGQRSRGHIYADAYRLARTKKPVVAAIHGAAIGAGLGLALLADFRVGCAEARLSANFTLQGYHPGFGLTFTLPHLIGPQKAAWMFYSGERLKGEEAAEIGLLDRLVPIEAVRPTAMAMATQIAGSGPLAVQATRVTLRGSFVEAFTAAIQEEMAAQESLRDTEDFREGVRAMTDRRPPVFTGR
jgi:enoyl-CoA hydratase/carnithine racemase